MAANFLMTDLRSNSTVSSTMADSPHRMNRYMGGHKRSSQPYVSGYWYFMILTPDVIFDSTKTSGGAYTDPGSVITTTTTNAAATAAVEQQAIEKWFHSTAESFTPPSTSLTKMDVPGMGGLSSSFITGREITRTFTVSFREYTNLPIMTALMRWNSIMDPYLGVSALTATDWKPSAYKGVAVAFLCKPTVSESTSRDRITFDDVEQIYYFDGVWPESAPHDSFNSDISTNDGVQLSVTFNFDGWAYTKETLFGSSSQLGKSMVDMFNNNGFTMNDIINHITNNVVIRNSNTPGGTGGTGVVG